MIKRHLTSLRKCGLGKFHFTRVMSRVSLFCAKKVLAFIHQHQKL